jgi:DNA end-binding protein Ku
MPRAMFKGSLSFGLVNIPVKLYNATKDKSISFHMIHSECQTPLKYRRWCPKCEREVGWDEIDHGYPITEQEMVVIKKEELEALHLKTTRTIEIRGFVDLMAIDPIYFASHYYLVPQEGGEKAYSLLRDALSVEGKAAVGKVVLHNKEHVVSIRPYRRGLLMNTLNYADEILDIEKLEELEKLPEVGEQERRLATALIKSMSGDFKPEEYEDSYRKAAMQLIKQKAEGVVTPAAKPVEVKATVDIMKALEESIRAAKEKRPVPA